MWTLDYVKDASVRRRVRRLSRQQLHLPDAARSPARAEQRTSSTRPVTDKARAYHSSYFEMLGEQGWPGLVLWLWLQLLGVWQMERIRWRFAQAARTARASWQWGLATALQQAQLTYLVGAAFVGIAYQPFIFMLIGLQCGLWSYVKRTSSEPPRRGSNVPAAPASCVRKAERDAADPHLEIQQLRSQVHFFHSLRRASLPSSGTATPRRRALVTSAALTAVATSAIWFARLLRHESSVPIRHGELHARRQLLLTRRDCSVCRIPNARGSGPATSVAMV